MTVHTLVKLLPDPDALQSHCRALALLDFVLDPSFPAHSFTPDWRPGVGLATMDNGSGDEYAVVFDPAGVFLYGFDHESAATPWREWPRVHWRGLLDGLPAPLARYAETPEFRLDGFFDATVCVWREKGAAAWRHGPVEFADDETDGSGWLFGLLTDRGADAYADYAEDCLEQGVDRDAVAAVLAGAPLSRRTVTALSSTADFDAVAARARAVGYTMGCTA
ncbi:hypothetical protein ACH4PU_23710 [Streptomyces sp. NPDC021100]|uniref:hypothetical protein n=1 Tax=Streptomyces sp. NPDC021100 TaxID=3365114 RepID=UPI0037A092F5